MKIRARFLAVACALALVGAAQAVGVPGQGTWETTLLPRDLDGNAVNGPEAFYDTALDITWLRNANVNGGTEWNTAVSWAAGLDVNGVKGWRLPKLSPVNGSAFQEGISNNGSTDFGYAKTGTGWGLASEMGHLFYVTLGNKGFCMPNDASPESCVVQPGFGLGNTGDFQDMRSYIYWSGLEYGPDPSQAWVFITDNGNQTIGRSFGFYAMAVHPGDVGAAVPEPQTYALMLAGLGVVGLLLHHRRNGAS